VGPSSLGGHRMRKTISKIKHANPRRVFRLTVLTIAALATWGALTLVAPYVLTPVTDQVAKATIASAFIGLFGVVFAAVISEISSYYNDRKQGMQRKWELVFPLIRDYYNPWIQGSQYFSVFLRELEKSGHSSFDHNLAARALFYQTFFYSRRLKFSIEAGGRPILADTNDEELVLAAYREVEKSLDWAGADTRSRVSRLQGMFLDREKQKGPYLSHQFIADASDQTNKDLYDDCEIFGKWVTVESARRAAESLEEFRSTFRKTIDKFYTGWT